MTAADSGSNEKRHFADVLRVYVTRSTLSPRQLSQLSHVPEETLINWLTGRVRRPRRLVPLLKVIAALHLEVTEANDVLRAAGYGALEQLKISQVLAEGSVQDRDRLTRWLSAYAPTLGGARRQLRAPVADFIGRQRELHELVDTIRSAVRTDHTAIMLIRGLGGAGKTELALAAAQQLTPLFPDAQILLEFHGTTTAPMPAEEALRQVIRAFDRESQLPCERAELERLYRTLLNGKRVLILADDASDAAQIRSLLPPPGSALILTSRTCFHVEGMRPPIMLSMLSSNEAAAFLRALYPPIESDADRLAALCGYLPLALRVSASVAQAMLTHEDYLARLEDERTRLTHLRSKSDPALDVDASLTLSYRSLDPIAQIVLVQLSVFAAHFDRDALLAVVQLPDTAIDDTTQQWDRERLVLDAANTLYRRSLLTYDRATQRYSLHDLVRVFAATQGAVTEVMHLRYAQYYAAVATEAHQLYHAGGAATRTGLELFDRERFHIDRGWQWVHVASENVSDQVDELLMTYAVATIDIGQFRYDNRNERLPLLTAALHAARRHHRRDAEGLLLHTCGEVHAELGEFADARTLFEQSLLVMQQIGDRNGEAQALGSLGRITYAVGKFYEAIAYHEQSLAIAQTIGDLRTVSYALGNLGWAYRALGNLQQAIGFHQQSLAPIRVVGDRQGESYVLGNLGSDYCTVGDLAAAEHCFQQGLAIAREIGDQKSIGYALGNLAWVAYVRGSVAEAICYHEQSLTIMQAIGNRQGEGYALRGLADACCTTGDATRAIQLCDQALAVARALGDQRIEGAALHTLGRAAQHAGDLGRAIELCEQALTLQRAVGDQRSTAQTLTTLGNAYAASGQDQRARNVLEESLALSQAVGDRHAEAEAAWTTGLLLAQQGDADGAVKMLQIRVDFDQAIAHTDTAVHKAYLLEIQRACGED